MVSISCMGVIRNYTVNVGLISSRPSVIGMVTKAECLLDTMQYIGCQLIVVIYVVVCCTMFCSASLVAM